MSKDYNHIVISTLPWFKSAYILITDVLIRTAVDVPMVKTHHFDSMDFNNRNANQ